MATSIEWNDIPDIALIYVYRNLSDSDKSNVALTCKNWSRLFATAALWRHRRVVFSTTSPERTAEKEIKFIEKFGHCLYKLTLNFGRPTFQTCMTISKSVETFLNRISNRRDVNLRELDLECMHMEQYWHFILSRNRLISALCKMIGKQRNLETIYMAGARMRLVDGCRVLEALGKGRTRSSITTLYMEDFFETNLFPSRHLRYVSAMSKFLALEEIHINYRYLSAVVLKNMASKLHRSLEHLSLVLEGDLRGVEIPADAWMEFSEKCPLADVGAYLCTTILRGNDLRPAFVRWMPLNQLYLTSWSSDENEQRLGIFLRHLGNLYNTCLENFSMFFEHHEQMDADLLYMLKRCRKIKDLCIQARISADTVISIMSLQHQGKLALRSINLTIHGLSSDDWHRVDAEKEQLLASVTDFKHVGPTDFGSSIGGSTITIDSDDEGDLNNNDGIDNVVLNLHANNVAIEISDDEDDLFEPQNNRLDLNNDDEVINLADDEGFLM